MNRKAAITYADAWLKYVRVQPDSEIRATFEWVIGASVEWSMSQPETLCLAILELVNRPLTASEIEQLGCGPLDTLLAWDYENSSRPIFRMASKCKNLLDALQYVSPVPKFERDFELNFNKALYI